MALWHWALAGVGAYLFLKPKGTAASPIANPVTTPGVVDPAAYMNQIAATVAQYFQSRGNNVPASDITSSWDGSKWLIYDKSVGPNPILTATSLEDLQRQLAAAP